MFMTFSLLYQRVEREALGSTFSPKRRGRRPADVVAERPATPLRRATRYKPTTLPPRATKLTLATADSV